MLAVLRFSLAHPRWVLSSAALLSVLSLFGIPRIQLRLDARSLIPAEVPAMAAGNAASQAFGMRDTVVVALAAPHSSVYSPEALGLLTALSRDLAAVDGIVPGTILSLATAPRVFVQEGVLDLRPRLDREGMPDLATVQALRFETTTLGLDDGMLVSRDGKAAAIYAEVNPETDRARISAQVTEVVKKHSGKGFPLYFSGAAMAQAVLGEAAAQDLIRLVPLVIAVVAGVMTLAFRHPAPAFVSLVEVGCSLCWTVGLLGFQRQSVFVTTLILPVVLIVIGVTDDVYVLNSYFRLARKFPERPVGEVLIETFREVGKPVVLTSLTTVSGLLSLALTDLEPQRLFGIYGAISVLFSSLLTFTVVPAALVLLKLQLKPVEVPFVRGAERLIGFLRSTITGWGPRRVLVLLALVLGLSLWQVATRLKIEDNWVGNLPPSSPTVQGDRAINRLLAGTDTIELMFDSGKPEGFLEPRTFAALGRIEEGLAADPRVGAVAGTYSDVVRLNAGLAGVDYRQLREELRRGERHLSRTEIEQSLMLLSSARQAPGAERLDPGYARSRMTLFVRAANYSRLGEVLRTARRLAATCFGRAVTMTPFGDGWISFLTVQLLVLGQVWSISFALLSDTTLLVLLFRSLKTALLAVTPVISCILLIFGTLAVSAIPLGSANSMFASIVLGIGVDYSIHLVTSYRERIKAGVHYREAILAALTATGPAILLSAFAIVAGFSVMAFSEVPPNRQLGLLVCLSLALCALMTLVLLPTLVLSRRESS